MCDGVQRYEQRMARHRFQVPVSVSIADAMTDSVISRSWIVRERWGRGDCLSRYT